MLVSVKKPYTYARHFPLYVGAALTFCGVFLTCWVKIRRWFMTPRYFASISHGMLFPLMLTYHVGAMMYKNKHIYDILYV